MTLTLTKRAALAAGVFAILVGIYTGTLIVQHPEGDDLHAVIPWPDGGRPAGATCIELDGLSTPESRAPFGVALDAGQQYVRLRVGLMPGWDGGTTGPDLPPGYMSLEPTEREVDPALCEHLFEAWVHGPPTPNTAACAPATDAGEPIPSTCEQRLPDGGWQPAPVRVHMPAGTWREAEEGDCVRKSGAEYAGVSSWPVECGPESLP